MFGSQNVCELRVHKGTVRLFPTPAKVLILSASFHPVHGPHVDLDACGSCMFRWTAVPHAAADLAQHEAE